MKLSACMIVKNEERNISRCIESYKDIVSEVIVVDTGSTDKTVEIARNMGAKVFHFSWNNNFSEAKNFAIDRAKGDWIIFLDADEYFAQNTAKNIIPIIKGLDKSFDTIATKMVNIDYVNGQMLDEVTHVRIFRRNKSIRYVNAIHEMLINREKNRNLQAFLVEKSDLVIYHTGYSLSNRREKAERNLELLLLELNKPPVKPAVYQYLSDCYFGIEDWEKSIQYARLFIDSGAKFIGYNVKPHQNIIDSMLHLKYSVKHILEEIYIGIEKFPKNPSFRFYLANMLYDLKKYDEAFVEYKNTLDIQKKYDDIEINSIPPNIYHVYYYLGVISEHRNDYEEAVAFYIESLKQENKNEMCFDRLMLLVRNQAAQDIIVFFSTLYDLENEADLDFLVSRLVNHASPTVLAYYTNLREKKHPKKDFILLQMFVASKYYSNAFPILLDCYVKDSDERLAIVTTATALLSNNNNFIAECMDKMPPELTKIIRVYYGAGDKLDNDEKRYFLQLVNTFILWADKERLEHIIGLANRFPHGFADEIAAMFVQQGYYSVAIQFYINYLNDSSVLDNRKASANFNLGYCFYRSHKYNEAVAAFIAAFNYGYRGNDIFEFLRWNLSNHNLSSNLKTDAQAILNGFSPKISSYQ